MPMGRLGYNVSIVDSLNVGISARSSHKELAWEFLKLLTSDPEIQTAVYQYDPAASVLPAVTESPEASAVMSESFQGTAPMMDGVFISQVIRSGKVKPKFAAYQEAVQLADGEILRIYDEDTDLENAMRLIQRRVQSFIQR